VLMLTSIGKAVSEILALAMLGQGVLWLVAGKTRENNSVYRLFASVTRPMMWIARKSMPRIISDRHIWWVAVLLLIMIWVLAAQHKLKLCVSDAPESPLCVELVKTLNERATQKAQGLDR
jgi:hypothetical protein